MANRNWNVNGYRIPNSTELTEIMGNLTEEEAITLADRLSRLFGIECFAAEKI